MSLTLHDDFSCQCIQISVGLMVYYFEYNTSFQLMINDSSHTLYVVTAVKQFLAQMYTGV